MSHLLEGNDFDTAKNGFRNPSLDDYTRCRHAWKLLRHFIERDHDAYLTNQQMNEVEICLVTECLTFLFKKGMIFGTLATDIMETIGEENINIQIK